MTGFAPKGIGCLPVEPKTGVEDPEGTRYLNTILHTLGYADPNDWAEPTPTGKPKQWMVIMTKILVME
jgi:hypothetical protein